MAESKVLQFFLLVSLMILSTHALKVFLMDGMVPSCFEYKTEIKVRVGENGVRHYNGRVKNDTYTAGNATTKVIVYIRTKTLLERTALLNQRRCIAKRLELARELRVFNYELLYLGVLGFRQGDERLVGEFLHESIKHHPDQENFQINTIGQGVYDKIYETTSGNLSKYVESKGVLGWGVQYQISNLDG